MASEDGGQSPTRIRTISNDESEFQRITDIRKTSGAKAEHCIETIDDLNNKISDLTSELETYAASPDLKLVVEKFDTSHGYSEALETNDTVISSSPTINNVSSNGELEKRQLDRFSGAYTVYATLTKDTRTKHVSPGVLKKSFGKKTKQRFKGKDGLNTSKKPMLVELHAFPGFDKNALTPLPSSLSTQAIANLILNTQDDLTRKPSLKKEFQTFFCDSERVLAILQDTFWWYFCSKYQPNTWAQVRFFNRIAQNYTRHVIGWIGSKYQRRLFERLPDLVCQGVYAVYCHAFPESYKQFDDVFKDTLVNVVYQWMVGTKPAPRSWKTWNFEEIEPTQMRKREQMEENAARAKMMQFDLSFLSEEALRRRRNSKGQWAKSSGLASNAERRRKVSRFGDASFGKGPSNTLDVKDDVKFYDTDNNEQQGHPKTNHLVPEEARQRKISTVKVGSPRNPNRISTASAKKTGGVTSSRRSLRNSVPTSAVTFREDSRSAESCVAGRGADFSKVVFDVYGRSPLVEHFMQSKNLARDSGCIVYVQRTEIEKLPPLSMPTYRDLIKDSLKISRSLATKFRRSQEENSSARSKEITKWKEIQTDYSRRCTSVLENPKEVRKLSDLLRHQGDAEDGDMRNITLSLAVSEAMGYNNTY